MRRNGIASVRWSLRITIAATAAYVVGTLCLPGHAAAARAAHGNAGHPGHAPLAAGLRAGPDHRRGRGGGARDRVRGRLPAAAGGASGCSSSSRSRSGSTCACAPTWSRWRSARCSCSAWAPWGPRPRPGSGSPRPSSGGAVGILVTLVFPPKGPPARRAGRSTASPTRSSVLLTRAADELDEMAEEDPRGSPAPPGSGSTTPAGSTTTSPRRRRAAPARGQPQAQRPRGRIAARRAGPAPGHRGDRAQHRRRARHDAHGGRRRRGDWLVEPAAAGVLHELATTFRAMAGRRRRLRRAGAQRGRRGGRGSPARTSTGCARRSGRCTRPGPPRGGDGHRRLPRRPVAARRRPRQPRPSAARARPRRAGAPPAASRSWPHRPGHHRPGRPRPSTPATPRPSAPTPRRRCCRPSATARRDLPAPAATPTPAVDMPVSGAGPRPPADRVGPVGEADLDDVTRLRQREDQSARRGSTPIRSRFTGRTSPPLIATPQRPDGAYPARPRRSRTLATAT